MVFEWVPAHRVAGTLADLATRHPDELVSDLAAIAAAKVTGLPLVTGQPGLVGLDPDVRGRRAASIKVVATTHADGERLAEVSGLFGAEFVDQTTLGQFDIAIGDAVVLRDRTHEPATLGYTDR